MSFQICSPLLLVLCLKKILCNPYLHASKQNMFPNNKFSSIQPCKRIHLVTQTDLLKRPEARFPLFYNKHRLPSSREQTHTSQSGRGKLHLLVTETDLACVHPLFCLPCWVPSSDFHSHFMCVGCCSLQLDSHTDVTTATTDARPQEWPV